MTRTLAAALAAISLSACSTAGLNVSWWASMSYNADVETVGKANHRTSPVPTAAASSPAPAASGAK